MLDFWSCSGYIHMGFHHSPKETDMERLEEWFNHNVLHANGIMHRAAHFEWDTFRLGKYLKM